MELLQLQYFCSAAETENFAESGKLLNVPAASVSQSVRRLEKELGVDLFDRKANRIELNQRGRAFYIKVKSGLSMLQDAQSKAVDEGVEGTISLLVISQFHIVNQAIEQFCRQYPNVSFQVDREKRGHHDKYDLILTDDFTFQKDYTRKGFLQERIVLAHSIDHPLAKKATVTVADLRDVPLIMYRDGSAVNILAYRVCAQSGFLPRTLIRFDDPYCVAHYVEHNLGVALLPEVEYKHLFSDQVLLRPITETHRSNVLCYNTRKYMSKAVRLFMETLYTVAEQCQ